MAGPVVELSSGFLLFCFVVLVFCLFVWGVESDYFRFFLPNKNVNRQIACKSFYFVDLKKKIVFVVLVEKGSWRKVCLLSSSDFSLLFDLHARLRPHITVIYH